MSRVEVNRLDLRLTGMSPQVARSAVSGLGAHVLEQVAGGASVRRVRGRRRVPDIECGTIRAARGTTPSGLRAIIARAVSEAVLSGAQQMTRESTEL